MKSELCILILAAGASKRMKEAKQLLPWGSTSLVNHSINTALATRANATFIVLGAYHERIANEIMDNNISILINEDYESGIASSIGAGIRGILQSKQPSGILIMLSDQPFITGKYLDEMIDTFKKNAVSVVCTDYDEKVGVPVIFGAECFQELLELKGDNGAALLISEYKTEGIALKAGNAVQDIDTMEDYLKYRPVDSR